MNFKNWLIKEGAIQVPFKVFEPIVTDYFNYLKNNIEKPQRKNKKKQSSVEDKVRKNRGRKPKN